MTETQLEQFEKAVRRERRVDWASRGTIVALAIIWLLYWVYPLPQVSWLVGPVMAYLMLKAFSPMLSPFMRRRPADIYRQIIEQQINVNPDMIRRLAADRAADHSTPAKEI